MSYLVRTIDIFGQEHEQIIKHNENGSVSHIPKDPANTSYQEYLQWLAEGNEPLPADDPEGQTA